MNQKKNIVFSLICVAVLLVIGGLGFYFSEKQKAYDDLYLNFKKTEESYEIQKLDPVRFVAGTNAKDIDFPEIDPKEVGEHTYVYVARDSWNNKKEYVLKLKFEDPYKPVIELTVSEVHVTEGNENIDYNSFVKNAYDPVDGNLKVKIKKPKKLKTGENQIVYSVQDKHKNKASAILKIYVDPKPEEKTPPQNESSSNDENSRKNEKSGNDGKTEKTNPKNDSSQRNETSVSVPSTSVPMPSSRIFRIDSYGSIAAADKAAKDYGTSSCPAGHTWNSTPYSENGVIIGYQVTFN